MVKRRSRTARNTSISAMPKAAPAQTRGPTPNGNQVNFGCNRAASGENRSGRKLCGASHQALWRWISHGTTSTRLPAGTSHRRIRPGARASRDSTGTGGYRRIASYSTMRV